MASSQTIVYSSSKGRLCHSFICGRILSVMALRVAWEMSVSYISLMCLEMSRKLIPRPYIPSILDSRLSARMVSRFRISSGSKVPVRSRGVSMVSVPSDVLSCFWPLPFFRLPELRSSSSKWPSNSACKAASKKCFSNGANAPSLPYRDLPERNCSKAFFLINSKSNSGVSIKNCVKGLNSF
ncbi:hypothetical protein D3C73_1163870 [compost metagenome]